MDNSEEKLPRRQRPDPAAEGRSWTGPLVSLLVIGGLAAAGWWAGQRLAPRAAPRAAAESSAPRPAVSDSTQVESAAPSSAPRRPTSLVPEDPQIARLREQAIEVLVELEQRFPQEPSVLSAIGSLYALYALDGEAAKRWERSIRLAPKSATPYNAMGCSALVRGDYAEAIRLLRLAIERDPSLPRAQLMLGEALTGFGQVEQAAAELEKFVARHPDSSKGHFRLGQAYFYLKEFERAKAAQQRAIELAPDLAAAHHALAGICESLGEREEAERYRQEFLRLDRVRQDPAAVDRGGVSDVDLGRANLAEAHLVAARTYLAAAGAHRSRDLAARAELHLKAAAGADPSNRESRLKLLEVYDKSGRYREAAEVLGQLEQLDPENATHRINRGILLVRLGQFAEAEEEFRRAIATAPEEADGHAKLGWLLLKQRERLDQARDLALQAIALRPRDPQHHSLLSQVCEALEDRPAALAAIEKALELEPGNPRFREAKARLDAPRGP